MKAAIGFRAHSGRAALVVVAGSTTSMTVVDRQRIELADPDIEGSAQPYHAARGRSLVRATDVVKRCADEACRLARQSMRTVLTRLRAGGYDAVRCGLLLSSGRPAQTLEATLASHALVHTADGEVFRDAIVHACERNGIPVVPIKERELYDSARKRLGLSESKLRAHLADVGKSIGAPWREDQKLAALIGWIALA